MKVISIWVACLVLWTAPVPSAHRRRQSAFQESSEKAAASFIQQVSVNQFCDFFPCLSEFIFYFLEFFIYFFIFIGISAVKFCL